MNLVLIQQIVQILIQAVQLGVKYGPEILADLERAFGLATSSTTLTADEQAQVDATLDSANTALQAAVAAKTAEPTDAIPAV